MLEPTSTYFSVIERSHEIQNPLEPAQARLVADYLNVTEGTRVLDIGSGRGRWAVELAARGAQVTGLEINPDYASAAREHAERSGLAERVTTVLGPAAEFAPPHDFDVATCLGASFAFSGCRPALDWMGKATRVGGRVAIGDVHTVPGGFAAGELPPSLTELPTLPELTRSFDDAGFELIGLVTATLAGWDRYESLHWQNAFAWAAEYPEHPERDEILRLCRQMRENYLTTERGAFGWSVLVGIRR
ncbi:cyclopropane fatty-acyl-phospholipid synthase-like methyltransferase [Tamaricihabitans halophyticus]|uniref:Cyclopropane fatty-acyl-phospholipid synthase-like methyltransferase n=1 Tax=Tamaricihabitans halophyticus TaxID=1262583 RepID=A0A4V6NRD5_9PSEU|nr:class I SAM-dependent methyltransferase [Tamaricihabitans halophyticus]TCP54066.1 cyclopropane fatty-acyl-phospholipid synthase-like methyltransferase [Tamaricihabitans halophyticus]